MADEVRPIPFCPDRYAISRDGRVFSLPHHTRRGMRGGQQLKTQYRSWYSRHGYAILLRIAEGGKQHSFWVEDLVKETFPEVLHFTG